MSSFTSTHLDMSAVGTSPHPMCDHRIIVLTCRLCANRHYAPQVTRVGGKKTTSWSRRLIPLTGPPILNARHTRDKSYLTLVWANPLLRVAYCFPENHLAFYSGIRTN